jgi:glutathionyl-hydroquinone reductase
MDLSLPSLSLPNYFINNFNSLFNPELSKMSAPVFTSADRKSTLRVIETRTWIKIDGITKATRANNYQAWERQIENLFIRIDDEEIVLKNLQLLSDAIADKIQAYRNIVKTNLVILSRGSL